MKKTKEKRGITLIALIITIIVLLILAGVTISMVVGDNGVLKQSQNASIQTNLAKEKENIDFAIVGAYTEESGYKTITLTSLQDSLNKQFGEEKTTSKENPDGTFTIKVVETNGEYLISKTGEMFDIDKVTDGKAGELAGTGSEDDPFLIESIEDLIYFSYQVRSGNNYDGQYVELATDLNFASKNSYVDSENASYSEYGYNGPIKQAIDENGFIPIGNFELTDEENRFKGTFDGKYHKISNVNINSHIENNDDNLGIGFFSINSGTIKNLKLNEKSTINFNFEKYSGIGILAGINKESGSIINCIIDGNIDGSITSNTGMNFGGIVGASSGLIKGCVNKVNLDLNLNSNQSTRIGGICGVNENRTTSIINNCYNCGTIKFNKTGAACTVGGICGVVSSNKISNSYSIGKIIDISNIKNSLGECVGTNDIGENVYGLENTITTNSLSSINHKGVKTSNELKGSNGVTLLNTDDDEPIWVEDSIGINSGYPILDWQVENK